MVPYPKVESIYSGFGLNWLEITRNYFAEGVACLEFQNCHSRFTKISLKSETGLCMGGKNFPQIWDKFTHGRQKLPSNPVQLYARGAETSLKSGAYKWDSEMVCPESWAVISGAIWRQDGFRQDARSRQEPSRKPDYYRSGYLCGLTDCHKPTCMGCWQSSDRQYACS